MKIEFEVYDFVWVYVFSAPTKMQISAIVRRMIESEKRKGTTVIYYLIPEDYKKGEWEYDDNDIVKGCAYGEHQIFAAEEDLLKYGQR